MGLFACKHENTLASRSHFLWEQAFAKSLTRGYHARAE